MDSQRQLRVAAPVTSRQGLGFGNDRWPEPVDDRGQPDRETVVAEIERSLQAIAGDAEIVELRLLGCDGGPAGLFTASGFFDDARLAAVEAIDADESWHPAGTYVTLNPVDPSLASGDLNHFVERPERSTADQDIVHRSRLLVDFDPIRPSGVSSTDDELALAREVACLTRRWLEVEFGWPDPIDGMSGNGVHLVYAIDLPTGDVSHELIRRTLSAIADRRSTDRVDVDTKVHNAARITKVLGTAARKGSFTTDRPWRRSRLIHVPSRLLVVSGEQLEAVAALCREPVRPCFRPVRQDAARAMAAGTPMVTRISRPTRELLSGLLANESSWNQRLFNAACDMAGCGYGMDRATELLVAGARPWNEDEERKAMATIRSAFSRSRRPARSMSFSPSCSEFITTWRHGRITINELGRVTSLQSDDEPRCEDNA